MEWTFSEDWLLLRVWNIHTYMHTLNTLAATFSFSVLLINVVVYLIHIEYNCTVVVNCLFCCYSYSLLILTVMLHTWVVPDYIH